MSNFAFSPSKEAFFARAWQQEYIDSGTWPNDAVSISDDLYYQYSSAPPPGKKLISVDNLPAWGDVPPLTIEELIADAEQVRQQLLVQADATMLDWRTELMLDEISDANRAKLSAWLAYKNDVKSVDVTTDPEHVSWPVPPEA
ncbi:phage tail protein [Salmonella enterica subsp. enterica serovar Offa]|jgi:hypothetical protein|nr:phage tail protein [Salmonella enterica subsp. enterica serovar Offa]